METLPVMDATETPTPSETPTEEWTASTTPGPTSTDTPTERPLPTKRGPAAGLTFRKSGSSFSHARSKPVMRLNHLLLIIFVALLLSIGLSINGTRPASACADLQPSIGDAVWFYHTCHDAETVDWPPGSWISTRPEKGKNRSEPASAMPTRVINFPVICICQQRQALHRGEFNLYLQHESGAITIKAVESPQQRGKLLKPCGYTPAWGTLPVKSRRPARPKLNIRLCWGQT